MATRAGPASATTHTRPVASSAVVRWGAWAGITYVLAWLIGLFLAPSAPDPFGSAGMINAYFSAHRSAAMIQSVFIHGLAGVALLGLTAALWAASRNGALARWVAWLGAVTVVFLVTGGLAFVVKSGVLNLALDLSLPLLLLWAAAASINMIWRAPAARLGERAGSRRLHSQGGGG